MLNMFEGSSKPKTVADVNTNVQKKGKRTKKRFTSVETKISDIIKGNIAKFSSIIKKILNELETVTKGTREIQCTDIRSIVSSLAKSQTSSESRVTDGSKSVSFSEANQGEEEEEEQQLSGSTSSKISRYKSSESKLAKETGKLFIFDKDILGKVNKSSRILHQCRLAYMTATLIELRDITAQLRREVPKSRWVG